MNLLRRLALPILVGFGLLSAGCSNDVIIGAVVSETGVVASYGIEVKRGMDLALGEIQAAGGHKDFKGNVQLLYRDDATIPDQGERVVKELIEEHGVDMIIGALASPVTLRIAPICESNGVVLLSPTSSAPEISYAGDYIFRNYPSDVLEGTAMARFAKKEGYEKVVIFALDNEFGTGLTDVFEKEYKSRFREVSKVFKVAPDQTSGFGEMIEETKALKPDGIYIIGYAEGLRGLLTEIHEARVRGVLMGTSSVRDDVFQIGEAAEKMIFPRPEFDVNSTDPQVVRFVQAFRDKYGDEPDIYAAHGYDAVYLMLEAINAAGSTHPTNVKIGMSSIKEYYGAAGLTTFDNKGDVVRYPRLYVIHEGQAMPYDQFTEEGLSLARR